MAIAKRFEGTLETWNAQLDQCVNPNVFSLYEWGEYKSNSWRIDRICFFDNEKFLGQAQIFFKNIGPFHFGWCSSGINLTNYDNLEPIIQALKSFFDFNKTYIRFNFFDPARGAIKFEFDQIPDLKPVISSVNSGYTVRFYSFKEINPAQYSKNNKYYLKKAIGNGLSFLIADMDVKKFCQVHNDMADTKALGHLKVSESEMETLHRFFGKKLRLAQILKEQTVVAVALLINHSQILYYFLAGATEEGRKQSASFMMVDEILKYGAQTNLREFDFGGISPFKTSVSGINRFKTGFGGEIINYVGERNLCNSKLLTRVFDFIIARKLG